MFYNLNTFMDSKTARLPRNTIYKNTEKQCVLMSVNYKTPYRLEKCRCMIKKYKKLMFLTPSTHLVRPMLKTRYNSKSNRERVLRPMGISFIQGNYKVDVGLEAEIKKFRTTYQPQKSGATNGYGSVLLIWVLALHYQPAAVGLFSNAFNPPFALGCYIMTVL